MFLSNARQPEVDLFKKLLGGGFGQIFRKIVSLRIKALTNTNQVVSKLIKREKASLPLDVGQS